MAELRFEWDPGKAAANEKKHRVTFPEAEAVFFDPFALLIEDPDHPANEERFILLGLGMRLRVLAVVHCYREQDAVIRIISARKATGQERTEYQKRCKP